MTKIINCCNVLSNITKNKPFLRLPFILIFTLFLLTGCTGTPTPVMSGLKDITLDFSSDLDSISIPWNETIKLKFKMNDITAKISELMSYEVDKKDVVNVSKTSNNTFEIKGLSVGEANLKLSLGDKSKTMNIKLEVMDKAPTPSQSCPTCPVITCNTPTPTPTATPTEIVSPSPTVDYEIISVSSVSLCLNDSRDLNVRVTDSKGNDVNMDVNYELSKTGVVSITRTGNLFTLKAQDSGVVTLKLSIGNALKNVAIDIRQPDDPPTQKPFNPTVPTNLSATTITTTSFDLTWTGVTGATGYKVYRDCSKPKVIGALTTTNITGLTAGATYEMQVSAITSDGESDKTSILTVNTLPVIPNVPMGLSSSSIMQTAFKLTWDAMPGATGYKIYKDGAFCSDVTGNYKVITGLDKWTSYNMTISAVNASGESAQTAPLSVKTVGWENVGNAGFSAGTADHTYLYVYNGTPYVAYIDNANAKKTTVMKYNTVSDAWENVGSAGFSAGQAYYTSLYVYNGIPYVAYRDYGNSQKATVMKYNTVSGSWENVGSAGFSAGQAYYTSLYVYNGIPYVAYRDYGNSQKATVMKYNTVSVGWENVGSAGFSAFMADYISLYMDNGIPYVAYQDYGNSQKATVMKYNTVSGSWENVGSAGFSAGKAEYTSLSVYNGIPYVSYRDNGNGGKATVMKYNTVSGAWETVGSSGFSAGAVGYTSLSVYNGTPYVAYRDNGNGGKATVMKYNTVSGAWETVVSAGFSAGYADYTSLSVYNGIPYVAYKDYGNSQKATVMKF